MFLPFSESRWHCKESGEVEILHTGACGRPEALQSYGSGLWEHDRNSREGSPGKRHICLARRELAGEATKPLHKAEPGECEHLTEGPKTGLLMA